MDDSLSDHGGRTAGEAVPTRGALAADGLSVHRLLLLALSRVPNAVAISGAEGEIVWANAAWSSLTGHAAETAYGRPLTDLGDGVLDPDADATWRTVLAGRPVQGERRIGARDGEARTLTQSLAPIPDARGAVRFVVAIWTDVSELEQARGELARRAAQQTAIATLSQHALGISDARDILAAAERTLGAHLDTVPTAVQWVPEGSTHDCASPGCSGVCVSVAGRCVLTLEAGEADLNTEDLGFLRAVAGVVDATVERLDTRAEITHLASHDGLTGLPNRPLFLDRLSQAAAASARTGDAFAVLVVDLDDFKLVNDALGHETGDEVLRRAAARLGELVRPDDTVARFGGDEFAVLCRALDGAESACGVAARVHTALEAGFDVAGSPLPVSASVGVAVGDAATDPATLLGQADSAANWAKERGRNRTELFTPQLEEAARARFDVTAALRHALEHGGITVAHQPVLELASGRIVGIEALARLVLPSGATVPPDAFIGVAESNGLIGALGEEVLRQACADAAPWIAARKGFTVSVNLSPRQLGDESIVHLVERTLADTGVPAAALCLELTESAMLSGIGTSEAIRGLRALGVALALDDFGTGYSSLAHLRHMPIDGLKIDRSFVDAMDASTKDRALVTAAIDLAEAFGLATTAEGVETPAQRDALTELGCHLAQGYLWSRPVDAPTLAALLDEQAAPA